MSRRTPLSAAARTAAALALLALVTANIANAVRAHYASTPHLATAARVAALTNKRDLVVHEWDPVSVLYASFWGADPRRHKFDLPTSAVGLGAAARPALDRAVSAAAARGGRAFFLGIIDQPEATWKAFLGDRAGLPYASLAPYRQGTREIARLPYGDDAITLHEWRIPDGAR